MAALQEMKYGHATCDTCMNNGLHVLFTYGSEDFDSLALERVRQHHPDARLKGAKAVAIGAAPARRARMAAQEFANTTAASHRDSESATDRRRRAGPAGLHRKPHTAP